MSATQPSLCSKVECTSDCITERTKFRAVRELRELQMQFSLYIACIKLYKASIKHRERSANDLNNTQPTHCHRCQGHNFCNWFSTYSRKPFCAFRSCWNGAFVRGYARPPQSDMSTLSRLSLDGCVAAAYVVPILVRRNSLILSTSTRISDPVAWVMNRHYDSQRQCALLLGKHAA